MDRVRRLIDEIKEYGINNKVPIMSEDTIEAINKIINDNGITWFPSKCLIINPGFLEVTYSLVNI